MSKKKRNQKAFDEQFEAFLKDSLSSEDSINSARINKYLEKPAKKENKHWWDDDDGDDDDNFGTSRSFLKKSSTNGSSNKPDFRKPTRDVVIQPPKPKARKEGKARGKAEVSISKDSLDDISEKSEEDHFDAHRPRVHIPDESMDSVDTSELLNNHGSPTKLGMDTLDEMADKEKFFRDLERNADGTVDYGRLNQELSATANTMSPEGAARTAATLAALKDIEDEEEEEFETPPRPSTRGDQLQSEKDHSEQKPSMLSKVSLMDSLESTMNTTTSPQVGKGTLRDAQDMLDERDEYEEEDHYRPGQSMPETLKTATGLIGTNTSQEIEALHKALEKVGLSATIGNDSQLELSSLGDKGTEEVFKKLLNSGTGKPGKQRNVAEIMRELEDLQRKVGDAESPDIPTVSDGISPRSLERQHHVDDYEEGRGFDLSPVNYPDNEISQYSHRDTEKGDSSHRGGFDTSHTEATEMYQPVTQVSVNERGRGSKKEQKKRTDKKKIEKERHHQQTKKKESTLRRSRSSSPLKIDFSESMKYKFKGIKSSGYGQGSPPKPPRDRSRDKDRNILGYSRQKPGSETINDRNETSAQSPNKQGFGDRSPQRSPRRKDTRSAGKQWSPIEVARQKVKGSQTAKQAKLGSVRTTQLQASVESFAHYIKEHFSSGAVTVPEVKYSQDEPAVSSSYKEKVDDSTGQEKDEIITKLQADMEAMERSYQRQMEAQKMEYEQQMEQLKQENFVLASKVSGEDEKEIKRRILAGEQLDGVSKEQLTVLERELKEQETLISGYQQENKRLYNEMKNLQKQNKQTEERMFKENQKLLAEASNLRTQLEKKEEAYKNKGIITGVAAQQQIAAGNSAGVVANLEAELVESKRTADAVNREMMILQQSRVELEKHIEKLVVEREELKKKIEDAKTMKSEEAQALEEKYKAEIEKLNKKLKWYAENQELLDKGTKKLKAKDDVVHKLKMRIEELQTESGKRVEDSKVRARERAADTKKIQDLQRQVKEMEQILKRRNPNSLPSLMIAAAAAPDANTGNNRSAYSEVLEQRVNKLEKELEEKDGETDKLMRGVEQKYHSVKLQFEERIKELELQLSIYQGQTDRVHPHTHSVALERELESMRERYKHQVKELQAEVDRLTGELNKSKKSVDVSAKNEMQSLKETETELRALVKSLQLEVESKDHDLQVIQKSLERLRKEKQMLFTSESGKRQKANGKFSKNDLAEIDPEFHSLPAQSASNEKMYEPKAFEDTHITDVVKENEDLKMKVDRLQLQLDQQRVDLRKSLAESESILRQTRENFEEKVESLRINQQQEVKRILAQQALEHSTSRMAELQSKLDTQQVMIKHLREQQARLEVEAETASVLRIKQTRLEETIKSLHNDLKEAKKSHSPEMRHFEALQEKIVQIENKHSQREQELQQIIRNSKQTASVEIEREVEKWRNLVETKNNEIQKFRMELDSILEVLRVLQKQGVIIPVSSTAVS